MGGGSTPLGVSEGDLPPPGGRDLPPPIPGSIPDSSSPGVWRLRRLEAEGDTCIFPSEGVGWGLPGGGSHPGGGSLPLDASWHEEWQRRLGDWWAISPYTDALQVCLSAFSLHLASRLEAVWARVSGGGASRIASQRQQPHSVDAACEWVGEVELGLPPFPELRRGGGERSVRFALPPVPRLLPSWRILQGRLDEQWADVVAREVLHERGASHVGAARLLPTLAQGVRHGGVGGVVTPHAMAAGARAGAFFASIAIVSAALFSRRRRTRCAGVAPIGTYTN